MHFKQISLMKLRSSTIAVSVIVLFFLIVLSFNSYGTHDVRLWYTWAKVFTDTGFWSNYLSLSDIPLLATQYVYIAGIITKFIFGIVTEETFPPVAKTLLLPFLFSCLYLLFLMMKPKVRGKLQLPVLLMLLLNPAVILNLTILGYLDILFVAALFFCVYLLRSIESEVKLSFWKPFLFSTLLVVGPFIKPQWIMFVPVLVIFGGILFFKRKALKEALLGLLVGGLTILLAVSLGTGSFNEVITRANWVIFIYINKIGGQPFVVANFPNFWHFVNLVFHICQQSCGAKQFISGTCHQNCTISDFTTIFFRPFPYWINKFIAVPGKLLFIFTAVLYGFVIANQIIARRLLSSGENFTKLTITGAIWTNVIYAFFNTTVHENHFIAAVFLSIALFAVSPTWGNFLLVVFFTTFNFLNLFYYYGFGITGLFGLYGSGIPKSLEERIYFPLFGFNISLFLFFIFAGFIVWASRRLFKNEGLLGLTD